MNNQKKAKEEQSLREVLEFARKKQGRTHRILHELAGEIVEREDNERPDFILRVKPKSKHDQGKLIGIEHFVIDQFAFKNKRGVMESSSKKDANKVQKVRNKYGDLSSASNQKVDDAFSEFIQVICGSMEMTLQSGYNGLIDSFSQAVTQHVGQVPFYYNQIDKYVKKEKKELCFLIDCICDFSELYLVKGDKVNRCKQGYLPIYADIIRILEQLYRQGVQYVILAMRAPFTERLTEVLALPTKNIRIECRRQNLEIYRYAAKDRLLTENYAVLKDVKVNCQIAREGAQFNTKFTVEACAINAEFMEKLVNNAVYCAWWAKEHGESYVADRVVLVAMETLARYIVRWEQGKGENSWVFNPIYGMMPSQKILYQQVEKAKRKYGLYEGNENV